MEPLEFIKEKINASDLVKAEIQQKQINYFTTSSIQDEITQEYINQWANRKYRTDDYFLNWVKNVFRTPNFITFFKYFRHPLPSAKLVNDEIVPMLKRVYFADDSYFNYTVKGEKQEDIEDLKMDEFETELFNAILFRFNDIIIHDLEDINKPYRDIVPIKSVVAIKSKNNKIKKLAYQGKTEIEGVYIDGYAYMDDERYMFFDKELKSVLIDVTHDLGVCPATYISNEPFSHESDVVRKSIWSYVREEMEEYVFLRTLRKMSEPNGALPITVKLKGGSNKSKSGNDTNRDIEVQPMAANTIGSQHAQTASEVNPSGSVLQTGTVVEVPMIRRQDGTVDMDLIQNYLKFYYIPVECLEFIDKRIDKLERSIIANALGDYQQSNDSAKNEDQVFYSMNNKQDKLRSFAMNLSWVRSNSDTMLLGLKYGIQNIKVDVFYGSDFFLDTEGELFERFKNAPNQIERRNVLKRLGQTRYRFNPVRAKKEKLLYSLLPFSSDLDFKTGLEQQIISEQDKKLQLQFDYYIALFESNYGDIYQFYLTLDGKESEKLVIIKNLLTILID